MSSPQRQRQVLPLVREAVSATPKPKPKSCKRLNKVLEGILAIAIFLFACAPIFLHHSVGHHTIINTTPHQHRFMSTSSQRIDKSGSTIETVKYALDDDEKEVFNFAFEDEHTAGIDLPSDIGGAGRSLLLGALEKRPVWDEDIDPEVEKERCSKYFTYEHGKSNYTKYKGRKIRRRLFLGSLIADDSWHALGALAMETYGVYTAIALVESNRTQTGTPRKMRFAEGTDEHTILVERNLFGPNTTVLLGQYSNEGEIDGGHLIREHMQRSMIIDLWKQAGMTPDDIGVITDADETPTRDFLRAAQTCDMPEFVSDIQDCGFHAKVIVASMVFEGSPECMTDKRSWMHPDLILGKCIDGIGDDTFSLNDTQRQRKFAWRHKKYTVKFANYSGWPIQEKKTYPLWNAADFRRDQGGHVIYFEDVDYLPGHMGHTGYHFHNYFETTKQLRNKYLTYGHPIKDAENRTVAEMHPDLDTMVDCVLGRNTTGNKWTTLSTKLEEFEGRIPIAYGIEGYSLARHMELKNVLLQDTMGHETSWHENPKSKDWYEKIPK